MSKLSELGYTIKRVNVCTAHQWFTKVDSGEWCISHRDDHMVTRYQVFYGENALGGDMPAYRANGDVVVFDSYSSAYSYATR